VLPNQKKRPNVAKKIHSFLFSKYGKFFQKKNKEYCDKIFSFYFSHLGKISLKKKKMLMGTYKGNKKEGRGYY
jgi:hypothetical protein